MTIGFNILVNAIMRKEKFHELIKEQGKTYDKVKFINLSISLLESFSNSFKNIIEMLTDLDFDEKYKIEEKINKTNYLAICNSVYILARTSSMGIIRKHTFGGYLCTPHQ